MANRSRCVWVRFDWGRDGHPRWKPNLPVRYAAFLKNARILRFLPQGRIPGLVSFAALGYWVGLGAAEAGLDTKDLQVLIAPIGNYKRVRDAVTAVDRFRTKDRGLEGDDGSLGFDRAGRRKSIRFRCAQGLQCDGKKIEAESFMMR